MKKIWITFLSAIIAFGILLTGCSEPKADNKQNETTNVSNESTEQSSVSPEHEQLINEAMTLAKQGKTVTNQDRYKNITDGEVHKILGEASNTESADGMVIEYYTAGKHEMVIYYPCGSCMDDGNPLKIKSIEVQ